MIKLTKNKKSGFSLFEALVSMLIISFFFIASSKVITQKQPVEFQQNPHGYYECYIRNNVQYEHRSNNDAATSQVQNNNCIFEPPAGVTFFNVHYFVGSQYYNSQQVILNERIDLVGPDGIYKDGVFITEPLTGDQALWSFTTYLKLAHPSSYIYQYLKSGGIPPSKAVLISW